MTQISDFQASLQFEDTPALRRRMSATVNIKYETDWPGFVSRHNNTVNQFFDRWKAPHRATKSLPTFLAGTKIKNFELEEPQKLSSTQHQFILACASRAVNVFRALLTGTALYDDFHSFNGIRRVDLAQAIKRPSHETQKYSNNIFDVEDMHIAFQHQLVRVYDMIDTKDQESDLKQVLTACMDTLFMFDQWYTSVFMFVYGSADSGVELLLSCPLTQFLVFALATAYPPEVLHKIQTFVGWWGQMLIRDNILLFNSSQARIDVNLPFIFNEENYSHTVANIYHERAEFGTNSINPDSGDDVLKKICRTGNTLALYVFVEPKEWCATAYLKRTAGIITAPKEMLLKNAVTISTSSCITQLMAKLENARINTGIITRTFPTPKQQDMIKRVIIQAGIRLLTLERGVDVHDFLVSLKTIDTTTPTIVLMFFGNLSRHQMATLKYELSYNEKHTPFIPSSNVLWLTTRSGVNDAQCGYDILWSQSNNIIPIVLDGDDTIHKKMPQMNTSILYISNTSYGCGETSLKMTRKNVQVSRQNKSIIARLSECIIKQTQHLLMEMLTSCEKNILVITKTRSMAWILFSIFRDKFSCLIQQSPARSSHFDSAISEAELVFSIGPPLLKPDHSFKTCVIVDGSSPIYKYTKDNLPIVVTNRKECGYESGSQWELWEWSKMMDDQAIKKHIWVVGAIATELKVGNISTQLSRVPGDVGGAMRCILRNDIRCRTAAGPTIGERMSIITHSVTKPLKSYLDSKHELRFRRILTSLQLADMCDVDQPPIDKMRFILENSRSEFVKVKILPEFHLVVQTGVPIWFPLVISSYLFRTMFLDHFLIIQSLIVLFFSEDDMVDLDLVEYDMAGEICNKDRLDAVFNVLKKRGKYYAHSKDIAEKFIDILGLDYVERVTSETDEDIEIDIELLRPFLRRIFVEQEWDDETLDRLRLCLASDCSGFRIIQSLLTPLQSILGKSKTIEKNDRYTQHDHGLQLVPWPQHNPICPEAATHCNTDDVVSFGIIVI